MESAIIKLQTAKLAKEKGFSRDCFYSYDDQGQLESSIDMNGELMFSMEDMNNAHENDFETYLAPSQALLQEYLRVGHKILVEVYRCFDCYNFKIMRIDIKNYEETPNLTLMESFQDFKTYENALETGLVEALRNI